MRKIFLIITLVAALFVAVGYLLPDEVKIKREVRINAPAAMVYQQVSDLQNWDSWSGLVPNEPEKKLQYLTNEAKIDTGFFWLTDGVDPQKRRLLITGAAWCDSLSTNMSFAKNDIATSSFHFCEKDGTTMVSWEFTTKLNNNILARWRGPFIHNIVAPDLKAGLNKLKLVSEDLQIAKNMQLTENEK